MVVLDPRVANSALVGASFTITAPSGISFVIFLQRMRTVLTMIVCIIIALSFFVVLYPFLELDALLLYRPRGTIDLSIFEEL